MDPAFGRAIGYWQTRSTALRNEFKPVEYTPWDSISVQKLIDLGGDFKWESLFGRKKGKKAKEDSLAEWVEGFVSDVEKLSDAKSPNDNIRIVVSGEDEVADT